MLNIKKLRSKRAQRVQSHREQFKELRISEADGTDYDVDDADRLLDILHLTIDDLEGEVVVLKERRKLVTTMDAGDAAEVAHPQLMQQIEAAEAALKRMIAKAEADLAPLREERSKAAQAISAGGDAKRKLIETATDAVALQAIEDADAEMSQIRIRKTEALRPLDDRKRWIRAVVENGQEAASSDLAKLEDMKAGLVGLQAAYDALNDEAKALNDKYLAAQEALLDPNCI
ncbi:MAG: hypothetical protein ABGZ35_03555 [Planctomycetaceae bacterium]